MIMCDVHCSGRSRRRSGREEEQEERVEEGIFVLGQIHLFLEKKKIPNFSFSFRIYPPPKYYTPFFTLAPSKVALF